MYIFNPRKSGTPNWTYSADFAKECTPCESKAFRIRNFAGRYIVLLSSGGTWKCSTTSEEFTKAFESWRLVRVHIIAFFMRSYRDRWFIWFPTIRLLGFIWSSRVLIVLIRMFLIELSVPLSLRLLLFLLLKLLRAYQLISKNPIIFSFSLLLHYP